MVAVEFICLFITRNTLANLATAYKKCLLLVNECSNSKCHTFWCKCKLGHRDLCNSTTWIMDILLTGEIVTFYLHLIQSIFFLSQTSIKHSSNISNLFLVRYELSYGIFPFQLFTWMFWQNVASIRTSSITNTDLAISFIRKSSLDHTYTVKMLAIFGLPLLKTDLLPELRPEK